MSRYASRRKRAFRRPRLLPWVVWSWTEITPDALVSYTVEHLIPEMDRVMRETDELYEDQPINAGRKERAEAWDRAVYDILRRKADM